MPVSDSSRDRPTDTSDALDRTDDGSLGSLESAPLLDGGEGRYVAGYWPLGGEASAVRRTHGQADERVPTPEELVKRAERSERAHVQRARSRIRRYIRANRCRFMWTLTERDEVRDFDDAGAHYDAFQRAIREMFGRIPMVAVAEPQPGGHAWHWHVATDRFLSIEKIRQCWPHGHVWVGDGQSARRTMPVRSLARYMAKYIGKTLDDAGDVEGFMGRKKRQHRYRLAQGFEPVCIRRNFDTMGEALRWLEAMMGKPDRVHWFSVADDEVPDSVWMEYPDRKLPRPPRPK